MINRDDIRLSLGEVTKSAAEGKCSGAFMRDEGEVEGRFWTEEMSKVLD
jgi:hypothetical protein